MALRAGSIAAPCGGGPPAGRRPRRLLPAPELDDADLVATLRAELARHGVQADDLRCPSGLRAEVGESVRCTFTVGGQPVDAVARISAVNGDTVTYDVHTEARPVGEGGARTVGGAEARAGRGARRAPRAARATCRRRSVRRWGAHCPARTVCRTWTVRPPPSTAVRSTTPSSRRVPHDRIGSAWRRSLAAALRGARRSHGVRQGRHGRQRRGADQEPARHRQLGLPDRPEGRAGPVDRLQGDQGQRGLRRQGHGHLGVRRHDQLHDRAGRRTRRGATPRRPAATAVRRRRSPGKSVAQSVLTQLAADGKQVDEVSCPDLPATVGASERCTLKAGADTYGVTVTVTGVQGTDVKFDIQVDQTPTTAPSR